MGNQLLDNQNLKSKYRRGNERHASVCGIIWNRLAITPGCKFKKKSLEDQTQGFFVLEDTSSLL
ncbi:hypothetical protein PEPS_28910 (plasmid) [Persicobacter psychrovividus]|uniref:Uncharacterized protein n=1 Tax=Persicobacter psychrovividus TaxID=387638 RepID=A0ABN6LBP3_9BACT|nr:hypothetical protein PEPS_28910 [Persicobacter psychrovividus]